MISARRSAAAGVLALGWALTAAAIPASSAAAWWVPAPGATLSLTAEASNQGQSTLAISKGVPGWYVPTSGRFSPLSVAGLGPGPGAAVAVAAQGGVGVIAYGGGSLVEVTYRGGSRLLPSVVGVPRSVALTEGRPALLAVATSRGLFRGRLGRRLSPVARGDGRALVAPPRAGLAWLALVGGHLWVRPDRGGWAPAPGAPEFGRSTAALAELADGVVLVAEPGGLVWRGAGRSWSQAFQLLPYGGLGGVPAVTALVADGVSSAYLATDGFGTLLTPDGGYSWYRAAPGEGVISALATVGPVFSDRPHGLVLAASNRGVFLHRLQVLPGPPTYSPTGQTAELLGTAAVAVGSALLVTLLLWAGARRRPRLSV